MADKSGRKERSHERIVEVAARAIRRVGFDGVGVADVMKEAGLTHGGFYAHFASRNALLQEALERAGRDSAARLAEVTADHAARGGEALRALVEHYLSDVHLASMQSGCPVAALCSEMPRQSREVGKAAAQRVRSLVASVQASLPPECSPDDAVAIAAQLIGSLQMARVLGHGADGKALLAAARRSLMARYVRAKAR